MGIDPHEHLLSDWGLGLSAAGVREFGLRTVDAAAGRVGIVKPQVSFFERYGAAGFAALEDGLDSARQAGLIVIADANRGDNGTTMDAYARAWLTPGSPLEADALTVSPFLGVRSLTDTFAFAHSHGKGVFVLAATSNPEAVGQQRALVASDPVETLSAHIVREVSTVNAASTPNAEWASIGFVIGATVDLATAGLTDQITPSAPILAPGFGAQGAHPGDLGRLFGSMAANVIASESRSILSAGSHTLAARIDERATLYLEN